MKKQTLARKIARRIPPLEKLRCNIATSWNARNREDYVAMFHIGRCGSTVLANMLSDHSEFHWGAEIFEKDAAKKILEASNSPEKGLRTT